MKGEYANGFVWMRQGRIMVMLSNGCKAELETMGDLVAWVGDSFDVFLPGK
jgi:hypothetical protein